jgi:hypothetical protein
MRIMAIRCEPTAAKREKQRPKKNRIPAGYGFRIGVPKGIRTPVAAVKGQCPRPLDDGDFGGARRDRTADLNTASVALSQLSYGPFNFASGEL